MKKQEAIDYLNRLRDEVWNEDSDGYEYAKAIDTVIKELSAQPEQDGFTVWAKSVADSYRQPERKKGEWIYTGNSDEWYGEIYRCSICGEIMIGTPKYCSDCGAEMGGDSDDET